MREELANVEGLGNPAIDTLVDFRCEALILLGPDLPAADLVKLGHHRPIVVVGRRIFAGALGHRH